MRIRTLDNLDEVAGLEPLLKDYIAFVAADLERASGVAFDPEELLSNTLRGLHKVVPPAGQTFVAEDTGGATIGMVFLRVSGPDAMEIKRLYVVPEARGTGAGAALLRSAIDAAREAGVSALRLDTSFNLTTAIAMYERAGFVPRAPYLESDHYDDPVLGPHLVFMELSL